MPTASALSEHEIEILDEAWDSSAKALALMQALTERLIPIIAEAEGEAAETVEREIRERAQELDRAEGGRDVPRDRWALTRFSRE